TSLRSSCWSRLPPSPASRCWHDRVAAHRPPPSAAARHLVRGPRVAGAARQPVAAGRRPCDVGAALPAVLCHRSGVVRQAREVPALAGIARRPVGLHRSGRAGDRAVRLARPAPPPLGHGAPAARRSHRRRPTSLPRLRLAAAVRLEPGGGAVHGTCHGVGGELPMIGFAGHMALHMGLVAVVAPLLAAWMAGGRLDPARRWPRSWPARAWWPLLASALEFLVVWGWHVPLLHA